MAEKIDIRGAVHQARESMYNFEPDAILRGAQLTIVGTLRALQNPEMFKSQHYRQAGIAVLAGLAIRLAISAPIMGVKVLLWFLSLFMDFEHTTWDDTLVHGLDFIANSVLQVPFFMMSLMRFFTPTLDHMFMDSLAWVDRTYMQKHKSEDPRLLRAMYHDNLRMYPTGSDKSERKNTMDSMKMFLIRYARRSAISLAVVALSYVPYVGRLVLPAASYYTFSKAVGPGPATAIFATGVFLPRRYLIVFLQTYFSSRSLMRDLLEPYFKRVPYTKDQRRRWFFDREGLLFGFGFLFTIFIRIPLLGVLIYGLAEASTAYLITKITDPPPPPSESREYAESQVRWRKKNQFLKLPFSELDRHNAQTDETEANPLQARELQSGKKYF